MNSRGLKTSVLSWMYNLSIYFDCILVLTNVFLFCSILVVIWGTNYLLVHLEVPVAELVLMVRISKRVVLQKCMDYLEKNFVWMFGGFG